MARISPDDGVQMTLAFTDGITAMIPPLKRNWFEFVESFNSNRIEYLIVGAFACNRSPD